MSFLSILKKVGGAVITGEHIAAATGLGNLIPGWTLIDRVFQVIPNSIVAGEIANPAVGAGASKVPGVVSEFEAGLAMTREILAANGQVLTYDEAALAQAISAQVTAFNAMATVKASFKISPKPA